MARNDERLEQDRSDERGRPGRRADSAQLDQQAALRDDLSHAAEHQVKPDTELPDAARGDETGNARASARAAGDANPERENLPSRDASDAAYHASRGGRK